jgi:shikimate dehydrogenase
MTRATRPRAFVIGHPIAHSRSPLLHGYWLETLGIAGSYERLDLTPEALADFFARFRDEGFIGGNVTVPHKIAVMPYMAEIDAAAERIGAVNTIWRDGDRLIGGNTDAVGFIGNLDDRAPGWDAGGREAVLLGAGGAARAAIHGLLDRGFRITIVNRTPAHAQALATHFGDGVQVGGRANLPRLLAGADLLVNATSLGMLGKPPQEIDLAPLKPGAVVHDVVYVPLETGLLKAAAARGHRTVDGLGMLLHQAVAGFARWFGVRPTVTAELRSLLEEDIRAKTPGA